MIGINTSAYLSWILGTYIGVSFGDVIPNILSQGMGIGITISIIVPAVISTIAVLWIFGVKPAMYTLISMYVGYTVVDKIQLGLNIKKLDPKAFVVITDATEVRGAGFKVQEM